MKEKGQTLTLLLVFGFVFLVLLFAVTGLVLNQYKFMKEREAYNRALEIAEAGVNYYRWHLAHAPTDFCDGQPPGSTNCQAPPYGPFVHDYKDPEGGIIGKFSLMITPSTGCQPQAIIQSTGWDINFPRADRTVSVNYAKPSLAKYAFLTNSNAWFGKNEELKGPFHSNGGIRMDGEQNSVSTSARETYICGSEHGCCAPPCTWSASRGCYCNSWSCWGTDCSSYACDSPCSWTSDGCQCPGIWGQGQGQNTGLWKFPVPAIDFDLITRDLANLKQKAQDSGLYFGPSGWYGYDVKFLSTGGFNLYKVTRLKSPVWGWNGEKWVYESNSISRESFVNHYDLPNDCSPIFFEDNTWVSGDVKGRATVVAAKLPETPSSMKKIIIYDNINYADSSSVLGLISQSDILIPLYSPDNLEIKAALLAQNGRVYRYYYPDWWTEPYKTYSLRDYIETYGSIITNKIWTFSWADTNNNVISGYKNTEMSYDSDLTYSPPPYFPTYGDYDVFKWQENK